jgi:hypothetical protein
MENVATYSEARSEYTKQLASFVVPALVTWFQSMWSRNASDKQRCLSLFQGDCEEVARWNTDRVHDEVRALIERTGCDYMEELMTAVFVAHTKVLTAVRLSTKQKKLSITVPKLDHFVHRVFRETARTFWKTPFLFMDGGHVVERQKNILQIEALATEAITTAVRSLLPVKQILKDYMEDDEEDIVEAPVTPLLESKEEDVAEEPPVAPTIPSVAPTVAPTVAPIIPSVAPTIPSVAPTIPSVEPIIPSVAATETATIPEVPDVVKIDTEPSVSFSDYDEVFSKSAAPELVHVSRIDDGPSDGALQIDESSTKSLGIDDVEDLEAPKPKAKPVVVPALPPVAPASPASPASPTSPSKATRPPAAARVPASDDSLDSDVVVLE